MGVREGEGNVGFFYYFLSFPSRFLLFHSLLGAAILLFSFGKNYLFEISLPHTGARDRIWMPSRPLKHVFQLHGAVIFI